MKKVYFVVFLCLVAIVYVTLDKNVIKKTEIQGFYIKHDSLEKLEKASDFVIKVIMKKSEPKSYNKMTPYTNFVFSDVEILEIIKNETGTDLKKGDVITVREPYEIEERGLLPGNLYSYYGKYTELRKGNMYVLFGEYNPNGFYDIGPSEQGKYNIDKKDTREQEKTKYLHHVNTIKDQMKDIPKYNQPKTN